MLRYAALADRVRDLYVRHARAYDRARGRSLMERAYLERVAASVPPPASILDLGCGGGEPLARWFVQRGYTVTGVDTVAELVELCRERMPEQRWQHGDMRDVAMDRTFGVVVAWDSFFHLERADQRAMFPRFAGLTRVGGVLLLTTGPRNGEVLGTLCGDPLYHASLDPQEYRDLLEAHGFRVLVYRSEDPDCGRHTVWLAQREASPPGNR